MHLASYAVLVLNFNCAEHTKRAVASVLANARHERFFVQVVDNNSEECDRQALSEIEDPRVFIAYLPTNGGFAKGYNTAAQLAAGSVLPQYFVVMNPDVELVQPGSIETLIDCIDNGGKSVVGAQPRIWNYRLPGTATTQQHLRRVPGYWDLVVCESVLLRFIFRLRYQRYTMMDQAPYNHVIPFEVPSGAFFVIRACDFLDLNGFDEMTFLYGEELILGHKLRARGQFFLLEPSVDVHHFQGASTRSNRFFPNRLMCKYRLDSHLYYAENYLGTGIIKRWVLCAFMKLGELVRIGGTTAGRILARVCPNCKIEPTSLSNNSAR